MAIDPFAGAQNSGPTQYWYDKIVSGEVKPGSSGADYHIGNLDAMNAFNQAQQIYAAAKAKEASFTQTPQVSMPTPQAPAVKTAATLKPLSIQQDSYSVTPSGGFGLMGYGGYDPFKPYEGGNNPVSQAYGSVTGGLGGIPGLGGGGSGGGGFSGISGLGGGSGAAIDPNYLQNILANIQNSPGVSGSIKQANDWWRKLGGQPGSPPSEATLPTAANPEAKSGTDVIINGSPTVKPAQTVGGAAGGISDPSQYAPPPYISGISDANTLKQSPWMQFALDKETAGRQALLDSAAKGQATANQTAMDALASGYGLRGGAAERIGRTGADTLNLNKQDIQNQGVIERANLGMTMADKNTGINQFNIQNRLGDIANQNQFNAYKYGEQMKSLGANATANALSKGGKK